MSRLATILQREPAAGLSAALLHFADACCAAGVAIPPTGKEPRDFGLGRFPETTTRVRARLAAFLAGKCSSAADTPPPRSRRRLRPCGLPGSGPAPRPGAS